MWIKLIIALAPSLEQLIAALLSHWLESKKPVAPKSASKVIEAARTFGRAQACASDTTDRLALAAWAKAKPTPEAYKRAP
jgi:hypothetical protein